MPRSEGIDIDTPWDFRLAELIMASGSSLEML
jgi:hypothetical protein